MSRSFQCPMSSKDFNPETIEMDMKEEMNSTQSDSAEEFIGETDTTLDVDEIEIKHEEMDYHLCHNSTTDDHSEDHSNLNLETMPSTSTKVEETDLSDFYHDLYLCKRDCETCVKYLRMLSEHVSATHAPPQPIQDPLLLLIDPVPLTDQSSSIQIKSEVDENIDKMDCSDSEEMFAPNSDVGADYNIESDCESDHDPDYGASRSLNQTLGDQGLAEPENQASSQSRSSKTRKEILPSREHFKCEECGKSFKLQKYLNVHMRIHTGEKPFKCDLCEKCFARSDCLTEHRRIHTGEKPFKCDLCEKSFGTSSHLSRHKITHTGDKPYKCNVCGMRCTDSNHLNSHMRVHTGNKLFKCNLCEKSFSQQSSLSRHKITHTRDKPFMCDVCEKGFTRRDNLNLHLRTHRRETLRV